MYVKSLFINEISYNGINDEIINDEIINDEIKNPFLICEIVIKIKHIKYTYILKFMT